MQKPAGEHERPNACQILAGSRELKSQKRERKSTAAEVDMAIKPKSNQRANQHCRAARKKQCCGCCCSQDECMSQDTFGNFTYLALRRRYGLTLWRRHGYRAWRKLSRTTQCQPPRRVCGCTIQQTQMVRAKWRTRELSQPMQTVRGNLARENCCNKPKWSEPSGAHEDCCRQCK